jgi:hypothetical protein
MSLGLGIFLSVILIVVVWQVDKRGAWRKFGKSTAWLGALTVVGGAAIGGYVLWDEHSIERARARDVGEEARQVKAGELIEYWGVKLGMTQDEVAYLKGWPTKEEKPTKDRLATWSWGQEYEHVVLWDAENKVASIVCNSNAGNKCEAIAGVSSDSLEADLLAALGPPKGSPGFVFGYKAISYGSEAVRWEFLLTQGRVQTISVRSVEMSEVPAAK